MKKFFSYLSILLVFSLGSCESVSPGHKGVEVSWGGETNMTTIYPEGFHGGLHWMFDDLVEYDCREKTTISKFEFNDLNSMLTNVEISVDFNYAPDKVNLLHSKITDVEAKLEKTIKSAAKEVIPQYTAVDLNLSKRAEAEEKLGKILSEELPNFYLSFARVQITDVDLPGTISQQAEKTAEQVEKNKLASKMEEEKLNLGNALVAEAKGKYEAAQFDAKSATLLSTPANLKLKELEIELEWARKGISKYGSGNVFGSGTNILLQKQ